MFREDLRYSNEHKCIQPCSPIDNRLNGGNLGRRRGREGGLCGQLHEFAVFGGLKSFFYTAF